MNREKNLSLKCKAMKIDEDKNSKNREIIYIYYLKNTTNQIDRKCNHLDNDIKRY